MACFSFSPQTYKTSAMPSVGEIARAIGARVNGDEKVEISGVASIAAASSGDLVFVEDQQHLVEALKSAAGAVISDKPAGIAANTKPILIAVHPKLAFARAAALIASAPQNSAQHRARGVHPSVIVLPSATVAQDVTIGPWTFVGEGARIGERTWIATGCMIGRGVQIGVDCRIYPNVTIYPGTRIGNGATIHAGAVLGSDGFGYVRDPESGRYENFPQIGKLEIDDDVEIGANTTIDRGALEVTRIGRGTKIDNLVHIGHNCRIGENVIIAAQVGFSGSVVVEDNAVIGGQVGVGEHARIQEGVMLGGQAGVLPKKILRGKGVAFWGTPAKPLREYLKSLAALARLGKRE
jgi:UDP-3-O-[3-hydroxymyristoyl] glucosamine N-acyltransferase